MRQALRRVTAVTPPPVYPAAFGDLLAAVLATAHGAPDFMGAAYWIPAFWVPALLVTHYVAFVALTKNEKSPATAAG